MLEILDDEVKQGNKSTNKFKASSFNCVVNAINEQLGMDCSSKHVENYLKTIRSTWSTIQTLLNKSGFGWDDNLKIITANLEVYDVNIQKQQLSLHQLETPRFMMKAATGVVDTVEDKLPVDSHVTETQEPNSRCHLSSMVLPVTCSLMWNSLHNVFHSYVHHQNFTFPKKFPVFADDKLNSSVSFS
ncbi:hypothetical protein FXO37_10514 [Capsicum annuum]|nr:hypothetical protein FXO37_10514 [Capsicum annuum]